MKIKIISILVFLVSLNVFSDSDIYVKNINMILRQNGVSENYSEDSFENLKLVLSQHVSEEMSDDSAEFYKYALNLLEDSKNLEDRVQNFRISLRIFYSVFSKNYPMQPRSLMEDLSVLGRFVGRFPYVKSSKRLDPIGAKNATKEAKYLYDLKSKRIVSSEELASLSYEEISNLDVVPDHHIFYQSNHDNSKNWENLEKWHTLKIQAQVKDPTYNLKEASNFLFIKKVKQTATSPKVEAEDQNKVDWKVKWGSEIQTEPIANRLWMKVGGKFQDLVYVKHSYNKKLILVMESSKNPFQNDKIAVYLRNVKIKPETPEARMLDRICKKIYSLEVLKTCMLKSLYNFDISGYIDETGIIDNTFLENKSDYLNNKYKKEKLLNRVYVILKEALVELSGHKDFNKGGASSLSLLDATEDRAQRGLALFHYWIWNTDAKDENSRGQLLNEYENNKSKSYVETIHDLGASLGSPRWPGFPNKLSSGSDFISLNLNKDKIFFREMMAFYPKAWNAATFSDLLWMAKKIVSISKKDLEEIVKETFWPDFLQQLMVQKLLLRRNDIARIFGLENYISVDENDLKEIDFSLDLSTAKKRKEVALKYRLNVEDIESVLKDNEILNKNYVDNIIVENRLNECQNVIVPGLLEAKYYPSGLTRRLNRFYDEKRLENCFLGRK